MKGAARLRARGGAGARRVGPVRGRARARADRPARGAGRARGGPHAPARRDGLHRRLRRRLRDVGPRLLRRAHGPGDRGDHDHAARHADARAADAARHAAPAGRGGARWSRRCTGARAELAAVEHPWVGAETYFVGEVHGGDFYNRWPASAASSARAAGRRATRCEAVDAEYRALLDAVAAETGCTIDLDLRLVRGAYEIDFDHELSRALRERVHGGHGRDARAGRQEGRRRRGVFAAAGIPTVYHGPVGSGAHADVEYMEVPELVRATRGLPRAAPEAPLSDPAWMPSRAFAERYPNLLAIGGHPGGRHAAARGRGGGARGGAAGLRADARRAGAARGDRGSSSPPSSAGPSTRSGTCSSRSAACRRSTSPRSASARGRSRTRRVLLPAGRRRGRRHVRRDRRRRRPARLGRLRGGDRRPRRRSRSSTRR